MKRLAVGVLFLAAASTLLASGYQAQISALAGMRLTEADSATLGYVVQEVTVLPGVHSDARPLRLLNQLSAAASIVNLSCEHPGIAIEGYAPTHVGGLGSIEPLVRYSCDNDVSAGLHLVPHFFVAESGNARIELNFDVPVMVGMESSCGCGHGYWKTHPDWTATGYTQRDLYSTVFKCAFGNQSLTLMEALNLGGGGASALARQAVAALLNAAHPEVAFKLTAAEVIDTVCGAHVTGDYEAVKDYLEACNEPDGGCPLC